MPFVPEDQHEGGFRMPGPGLPVADQHKTLQDRLKGAEDVGDVAGAIWGDLKDGFSQLAAAGRTENMVGSSYMYLRDRVLPGHKLDPYHNPLDHIRGTKYENHIDRFVTSRNGVETMSIMRAIDREESDNRMLDAAGWGGTVARIAMGTLDPTMFIPGVTAVKVGRAGSTALRLGTATAGAGLVQSLAQEGVLQATQETRTPEEGALNIATGTLLSGILGAGVGAMLSRSQRQALEEALDVDRRAWAADIRGSNDNLMSSTAIPASASAAASDTRALELESSLGVAEFLNRTPGVKRIFGNPVTRTFTKTFDVGRRAMADLASTSLRFKGEREGEVTAPGGALDLHVQLAQRQSRGAVNQELDRLYTQHWKGSMEAGFAEAQITKAQAQISGITGRAPANKLQPLQFREEVGKAMRRGDQHEIPEVQQAAQFVRKTVFEPWKERAIKAGLLPEDVHVDTAMSYFMRSYNKQKINARRPEIQGRVTDWLEREQKTKAQTKERLQSMRADLRSWSGQVSKFESRLERLDAAEARLEARLSERAMEVGRTERRSDALEERATSIADELTEVENFIREMRVDVTDPRLTEQIDALEREAAELRRADRPVTEADLRRIEDEELRSVLTGTARRAAEMLTGRRKWPKKSSFLSWIVESGGVNDVGGDLRTVVGSGRSRPGLLNKQGRSLDEWGERIWEMRGYGERPTEREVLAIIEDAYRTGRDPQFWVERLPDAQREAREAAHFAMALDEIFSRAGIEAKTTRDVAKALRGDGEGVSLEDLDRIAADMEAAGESIPVSFRRAEAEDNLADVRAQVTQIRGMLADAIRSRTAGERRYRLATARGDEAALAANANRGRLGILEDRLSLAARRRELLQDALAIAGKNRDDVRAKIETELDGWKGNSAKEARAAIKAREKYAAERSPDATGRLTSADDAIDSAVRRIIESDRDLSRQELDARAGEIIDRIVSTPDGRLPYDAPSGGPRIGFAGDTPPPRGALAAREFMIPDEIIEDFLESDVEAVTDGFLRTMVPDVLLHEKFGDVEMTPVFKALREEHEAKSRQAKSEKERLKLREEYEEAVGDLAAVRDRIRSVYGFDPRMRNVGRLAQAVKKYNAITLLGGQAVNSLGELSGAIFMHGFTKVFSEAYAPFFRGLSGMSKGFAGAKRQYRAMGVANEIWTNARFREGFDLHDTYRPESRLERGLGSASDAMQVVNLSAPFTDWGRTITSIVTGNEIIWAARAAAEGKLTAKQRTRLAESGIDPSTAERIWRQFEVGGVIEDGVYLPNTADWTDGQARQAFEAAVLREADIAVIMPGQERPLWLSDPILGVLGQFKAFPAAATEKMLIRNIQRADMRTVQGLMSGVAAGMVSYGLYQLFAGNELSDDPSHWVREGVARAGVGGWFEEANTFAAKATRGQADLYRLIGADEPLSKYASRSALSQLLGPTAGKVQDALTVSGAVSNLDITETDVRALRRMTIFQNLFWFRRVLDEIEGATADALQ